MKLFFKPNRVMQQISKNRLTMAVGLHGICTLAVCTGDVFHMHSAATLWCAFALITSTEPREKKNTSNISKSHTEGFDQRESFDISHVSFCVVPSLTPGLPATLLLSQLISTKVNSAHLYRIQDQWRRVGALAWLSYIWWASLAVDPVL